jgi:hypothetical protein
MKEDQSMYPGSDPSTQYPYVKVERSPRGFRRYFGNF